MVRKAVISHFTTPGSIFTLPCLLPRHSPCRTSGHPFIKCGGEEPSSWRFGIHEAQRRVSGYECNGGEKLHNNATQNWVYTFKKGKRREGCLRFLICARCASDIISQPSKYIKQFDRDSKGFFLCKFVEAYCLIEGEHVGLQYACFVSTPWNSRIAVAKHTRWLVGSTGNVKNLPSSATWKHWLMNLMR